MTLTEYHPRILSLSGQSTPRTSATNTPLTRSRRESHESAHDAHHFVSQEDKTNKTLHESIKKMWKGFKHHAVEHHRSVNAAYKASYGAGARTGAAL